jgi:hypothetical protein
MLAPVTTIDTRYSDPRAVPVEWPATEDILASAELFWLTTVRADGRPHVTPIVGAWWRAPFGSAPVPGSRSSST